MKHKSEVQSKAKQSRKYDFPISRAEQYRAEINRAEQSIAEQRGENKRRALKSRAVTQMEVDELMPARWCIALHSFT